jgi:2-C-methyl-D-erythritol 4-phosphate cytidylyltransferase
MADIDKVWAPIGDRPVVWHVLNRLTPAAGSSVLVVRHDDLGRAAAMCAGFRSVTVVAGGGERQDSVRCGLAAIDGVEAIAVHDVARPMAESALLQRGLQALEGFDGVVPAIAVADTLKEVYGAAVVRTVDRRRLSAVQTPQVFRAAALRAAHRRAADAGWSVTDDAQVLEMAGFRVGVFAGSSANFKITTTDDLLMAQLLAERRGLV